MIKQPEQFQPDQDEQEMFEVNRVTSGGNRHSLKKPKPLPAAWFSHQSAKLP